MIKLRYFNTMWIINDTGAKKSDNASVEGSEMDMLIKDMLVKDMLIKDIRDSRDKVSNDKFGN